MTLELEEVVGLISKQPAELIPSLKGENDEWKSKEEILAELRKADKTRLDAIAKGESGKAVRLRMKKAQDFIRTNYGIESDADEVEDFIKLLVEKSGQPGKEKIVEKLVDLDEQKALEHPIVKALLKSEVHKATADFQKQLEDERGKMRAFIEEEGRKKLDAILFKEAEKALLASKAALDKDPSTREKQVRRFVAGLKTDYRFKLDENERPVPIDSTGEQLSVNYQDVSFADLVKQENIFGVHHYDPDKGSPGASSQPHAKQPKYEGQVPKTLEEFTAALAKETDPAKRLALREAYKASQQK